MANGAMPTLTVMAADPTSITLPADLLPADGRFGAGPSKVRREAAAAVAEHWQDYLGTSHRQSTVKQVVGRLRTGMSDFFSLPEGYEVVLGNGGATAFWEVAAFGLVRDKSQHLSFGEFGAKFVKAVTTAPWLKEPTVVTSDPGDAPSFFAETDVDVYAAPQNETSTGVSIPVRRFDGASDDALLLWDATSGAGGLEVDASQADVYYFAPQKAFGSDGGLWIALMSPNALARASQIAGSGRYIPEFLNLQTAIDNSVKDQTYNTPALATIAMTVEQVEWFNANGGMAFAAGRSAASAEILYGWADAASFAMPFVVDPQKRSNVVATIDFAEGVDAATIAKVLRANGIVDTEPYRKLGRNQLRIAMFPGIEPSDVQALTRCIDHVVEQLA
jgi:phosphoserine aminotransferase